MSLPLLERLVRADTADNPLRAQMLETGSVLQLIAAGMRNGRPRLIMVDYRLGMNVGAGLQVIPKRMFCPPDCPGWPIAVGQVDNTIYDVWTRLPRNIRTNPVLAVERLLTEQMVALQSQGHSGFIAPPFDVLEITNSRMHWRQRKSACGGAK